MKHTAAVPSLHKVTSRRWHIWLQLTLDHPGPSLPKAEIPRLHPQCPFLEELSPRQGQEKVKPPSRMHSCRPGKQEPKSTSQVGEAAGRQLDGAVTSCACARPLQPSLATAGAHAHTTAVLGERNSRTSVGWAAVSWHRWQWTLVRLSQPALDTGICVSPCLRSSV